MKGEKPTKYFFNLEKRHYSRKAEVELSNGKHLHKADEIKEEIENFYRDLYNSNTDIKDAQIPSLKISFTTSKYLSCTT